MAEINLKISGLKQVKQELRELQFDLSQATDPQQMAELSEKAGVLRDNLMRANEQVAVFAAGSPFERSSNAIGLMGMQIASLDFEGAAESAKLFATAAKGIDGNMIAGSLKNLGSVVTTLSGTFARLGMVLLTNPIFLIAAVITAVVVAVGVLLNKLGFLKPILDALSTAFGWIKDVIMGAVQALKDFTDWLGLTTFAAEDAAAKQIAAFDKTEKAAKKRQESQAKQFDQEIRLLKISGDDTTTVELQKQAMIIQTEQERYRALKSQLEQNKISKSLSDEEITTLRNNLKESKALIQQARFDVEAINKQEVEDDKKKFESKQANAKAAYEKAQADRKAALEALKALEAEYTNSFLTEQEREEKAVEEKFAKALESAKKYNYDTKLLEDARLNALNDVRVKFGQQEQQALAEKAMQEAERQEQLFAKEEEQYALLQSLRNTAEQQEVADVVAAYEEKFALASGNAELEKALIEQQKIDIAAINKKYADEAAAKEEEEFQAKLARIEAYGNASAEATKGGLQGISDLVGAFAGKSLAAQKKAFDTQKKLNIAMATIDTIKGAVSAFSGMVSTIPGPVGLVLGAIAAAGVVASGIANIKKISATKFEGGGSVGSAPNVSTGSASGASPSTPSTNLFGQNNNANNLSNPVNVEQGKPQVIKAVVVESDITDSQNKINTIEQSAVL